MKYPILFALCLIPHIASARVSVALAAGPATSTLRKQLPGGSAGISTFRAGVRIEKRLTPHFYLQPSVFYTSYGYSRRTWGTTVDYFSRAVDLPLSLLYKTGMPCRPRFVAGVGYILVQQFNAFTKTEGQKAQSLGYPRSRSVGPGYLLTAGFEMPRGFTLNTSYHAVKLGYAIQPGVFEYRQISVTLGFILNKVDRISVKSDLH